MSTHYREDDELPLLQLIPLLFKWIKVDHLKKKYGITGSQELILMTLYYRHEMSMGQIAEAISSSKEQATRAVSPLVEHGLINRFEDHANRRRVCLTLTDSGIDYIREIGSTIKADFHKRLDESITSEEHQQLKDAFQTMIRILSKVQK